MIDENNRNDDSKRQTLEALVSQYIGAPNDNICTERVSNGFARL
jgi:hypothetical protein